MKQKSHLDKLGHILPVFRGFMRTLLLIIFGHGLLCANLYAADVIDDTIAQAGRLKLADHPVWLALLHYKKESISRRNLSQADDENFFLAETGKTSPHAELEDDLRAFFKPAGSGHAQCLFPARWHWLKQQLEITPEQHDVPCPRLKRWMDNISSEHLTLVFPAMYLNNPGSTFGHTFLRFDDSNSVLLSHTLNYAAAYNPDHSLPLYVFNGLFGGYSGLFDSRRYFETIEAYTNLENRDIWEYQLNLTPDEIRQLLRHVWEVTDIQFDYFFFRENCSYRLLALLDVVRPEASLTTGNAFPLYAIPVDTVRAVEKAQLITKRTYRPSLASQLKAGFDNEETSLVELVIQLAEGEVPVEAINQIESEQQRVLVLDLSYLLLQFRGQAENKRAQDILALRSRLPEAAKKNQHVPHQPETGHRSARFALGMGRRQQQSFVDLLLRPAFHDLVDSPHGYVAGAEINVLDAQLRWYPDNEVFRLESLRFFNIVSLSPLRRWYKPVSWLLDFRLDRVNVTTDNSDLVFIARGGAGVSKQLSTVTLFAMAMLEADASDKVAKGYSTLAGVQLGVSAIFSGGQLLVSAESDDSFSGFELDRDVVSAELQFNLATNTGLRFVYRKIRYDALDDLDWSVRIQQYF